MTITPSGYARLIRAAGAQEPVEAVLRSLTENGVSWAALVTTSGRPLASVAGGAGHEVDRDTVLAAYAALPSPLSRDVRVTGPDGRELMALLLRAESRPLAILLLAVEGSADPELSAFGESAALLLRLQWRYRRRVQVASRMVRDSVTRLMFAGRLDSAFELAAEMGLAAPPTRPHVVCVCGLAGWDSDDVLDPLEAILPDAARQILAYSDDDECWMLLTAAQFQALRPELERMPERDRALKVLLTEQVPASNMNHRWQHWAGDIRGAAAGRVVDRSQHRGDTPSDRVHKLRASSPQVLEAVIEYLRNRGRWEAAADSLAIHRNTLRYRVASAEKLLGVDLTDPTVSSEIWLAMRNEGLISDR